MTSKPDHLERTAAEPRDKSLNTVILEHIDQVNDTTRIFRLGIPRGSPPFRFLPGQWLDVYLPGIEEAGGFTITSAPRDARTAHPPLPPPTSESENNDTAAAPQDNGKGSEPQGPYVELAVQKSDNPPAAWLWRAPAPPLLGAELRVRVGGSFVWPPPGINARALRRAVFVAGGVGVNPLVAMLSSLAAAAAPPSSGGDLEVRFLYSLRDPGVPAAGGYRQASKMLFLERIARVFREGRVRGRLAVFLTGGSADGDGEGKKEGGEGEGEGEGGDLISCGEEEDGREMTIPFHPRRCTVEDDVANAVGDTPAERRFAVVYVCGVPTMTDGFVAKLTDRRDGLGMEPHRVLCEKWW
ncbi:hypothetical protein GGS24DRAFT_509245 [Hypoxylon argillaceum]|nr:hypothetical protein GGS24DRAFT_509245 [Hypoxylon argillaceum]